MEVGLHTVGGGQGIGEGGIVGNDRCGNTVGETKPSGGIDDVGVSLAVDGDGLMEVARGGDGAVGKRQCLWADLMVLIEGFQGDFPSLLIGGRVTDPDFATGRDRCSGDLVFFQDL